MSAKAPPQFTQLARNPERSVKIGGNNQVFAPVYGSPFVRDFKKGRRYGTFCNNRIEDAPSACESADSMHSTMLAGALFLLLAAGWLGGGLCTGYEKLVKDADRLGSYQKILSQALDTSEGGAAQCLESTSPEYRQPR